MHREDAVIGTRARRGSDERSKLGVDIGFPTDEPSALERSFSEKVGPAKYSDLAVISESADELDAELPSPMEDRSE
jgi:hypothetical protein